VVAQIPTNKLSRISYELPDRVVEEGIDKYSIEFVKFLIDTKLSDFEKDIVKLYFFDKRNECQISRLYHCIQPTIHNSLHRATKKLRALYFIYDSLPPHKACRYELPEEERELLVTMYNSLEKPAHHNKIKSIIAKINDEDARKIYNLIYNYTKIFYCKNHESKGDKLNG
jgi:hypothetical protein